MPLTACYRSVAAHHDSPLSGSVFSMLRERYGHGAENLTMNYDGSVISYKADIRIS